MSSTKKIARTAGWIYLVLVVTGIFSIMYVPSHIIVSGDAAATANNITSSELLFRIGILTELISQIIFVFLVLALYRLFKEVNRRYALLMVALVVVSASTGFVNALNQIAALIVLSGADFLAVFEKPQLDALAYLFLRWHSHGLGAIQIFWGLWLFPFGLLVIKSGFIPKIFGVLLFIAGSGYVLGTFTSVALPQYKDAMSPVLMVLAMAELPIVFWLLIVGTKAQESP